MNKGRVIGLLKQHGDAILSYKEPKGTKTVKKGTVTHRLCTLDFKNPYIKSRTRGNKPWPKNKTDIVVFSWTDNRYWIHNPEHIFKVQPLSEILNNVRPKLS